MRISDLLVRFLDDTITQAVADGKLPKFGDVAVTVERPRNEQHGDFACGVAFPLARAMHKAPLEIAEAIVELAEMPPFLSRMEAVKPGFINCTIAPEWLRDNVTTIEELGSRYGGSSLGSGKRVQVEFVSSNPNGPIHIGHARGAVIGSTLANLLAKGGYEVQREFYLNDGGSQMVSFGRALYARTMELMGTETSVSSTEYAGEYLDRAAEAAREGIGAELVQLGEKEAVNRAAQFGLEHCVALIKATLESISVDFDDWFSERSLIESGALKQTLDWLEEKGYIAHADGAVWFRTTKFGAEHDDVLIRSGGSGHTYFATDTAYHYDKLGKRKFDLAINVWGGDHHSHVIRLKHALEALGCDPEKLVVMIAQMVHLKEDEASVKMSKRAGNVVTADELVGSVGADAMRYMFLSRTPSSQMAFDVGLAKKRSSDNPVFYVQYAHARLCSIVRLAEEQGLDHKGADLSLLEHPSEMEFLRALARFPDTIHSSVEQLEVHHLPYYAYELARMVQQFYESCRVVDDAEPRLSAARLRMVHAARTVLSEVLRVMGMTAPERM